MKNEFCTYEQALVLKELGFDAPCFGCYDVEAVFGLTVMSIKQYYTNSKKDTWNCSAPLYQQAFRWFREKYQLHFTITSISQESWQWHITKPGESLGKMYQEDFYTYEEAEQDCLDKLIEICKNK
jgi:hypothetical protein